MKRKNWLKFVALVLAISALLTALPITVFAKDTPEEEVYIKSVQLARAGSKQEAKTILEKEGYIFLDGNLNEGTGKDGIWLGYKTTTNPEEAIYDLKLMNMKGGFTLTSMAQALESQEEIFVEMANDLNYLIEAFIAAYDEECLPAQKAYRTLNFFRMVDNETELEEKNGLGYHIVNGKVSVPQLTEILLLCDSTLVDSIIKILIMGIQVRSGNWMKKLSELGPYEEDAVYYDEEDEEEFKRRAEQLLPVLQLYSQAYNAMDLSGLIPDKLDENFEPQYEGDRKNGTLSPDDATAKKLDENRYKIYKIVFDELAEYSYGRHETLKDFFCSLENNGSTKSIYPLVSVLSDAEFAALSYGCFLEVAIGATATLSNFDAYDEVYDTLTKDVQSVYLYHGVEDVLFEDDTVIGFTEAANRHMASTGELEFYEKESTADSVWEVGKNIASIIGYAGMAVIGVSKIAAGVSMGIAAIASATATATGSAIAKSAVIAGVIKVGAVLGSMTSLLILGAAVLAVAVVFFIVSAIIEEVNGWIDWDENPMPEYLYDVKEVGFSQTSVNNDIATEYMKKPVFALYKAVTDRNGKVIDLNARSGDSYQWIAMYASYDRQGDDAKPIKAEDLLVKTGNGETPEGYVPLSRFGEVVAYNLNQWDEDDDVNGVYVFYKQDQSVSVVSGRTYYIYDVYLQVGESDAHCIELLKAAGYTPLNVNLSPALTDDDFAMADELCTYIGYKTTTNKGSAIRDIRMIYGPSQGQIQYGAATYADCGSNGEVTLYATKYETAGTPLLAGGLICVNNLHSAQPGYEPVCQMTGGPAASFNVDRAGTSKSSYLQTYLYFLPETTFTSGKSYIGDIAFFYVSDIEDISGGRPGYASLIDYGSTGGYAQSVNVNAATVNGRGLLMTSNDYLKLYTLLGDANGTDRVGYYSTYNPYRAIYDATAVIRDDPSTNFNLGGTGYIAFNKAEFTYSESALGLTVSLTVLFGSSSKKFDGDEMNGVIYLTGNPKAENVHKASANTESGEVSNEMTKVQPLAVSDIICSTPYQKKGKDYQEPIIPSNFSPVANLFSDSKDAAEIMHEDGERKFKFYIAKPEKQMPYISGIYAVDELSLFRSCGGFDKGLEPEDITETMLLSQLAAQGATNFCGERIVIKNTGLYRNDEQEINAMKFGYVRTDEVANALRDVFLYFNKFGNDAPPKELYRGTVKYTVICEIPYNLTDYNNAPKPGIYLYGTTNKKAGDPIIDLDVSTIPFVDGYETVRTKDGRSVWREIIDFADAEDDIHPMDTAKNVYTELKDFFLGNEYTLKNSFFYFNIKREGDDLRKQKPYIDKLYVAGSTEQLEDALDQIFDLGAEGYVNLDLNEDAGLRKIYLGYSYTDDPDDAITDIWAYHTKKHSQTMTNDKGITYELVQEYDLNKDALGDYIWLYATKNSAAGAPIVAMSGGYKVTTGTKTVTWVDGTQKTATTSGVKRWGSNSYSDLNRKAGGEYVYLMFTSIGTDFQGTYTAPKYGADKTFSRGSYKGVNPKGEYIGGLYVMDKNTILQEKIAAGTLEEGSKCDKITDDEVKDRLKKMGAVTIIDTPISVTGATYFKNNQNKVYIGYSYTDKEKYAIRGIAIKCEILSANEPEEKITVDGNNYVLVAEAASGVTELPRAINLIGVDNGQDLLVPRMYLYYSTSADNEPIYDISIDANPIKNGWLTATSNNVLDPFTDISKQAKEHSRLADDYTDTVGGIDAFYNVYPGVVRTWLGDISKHFDPNDKDLTPFYIHTNHYKGTTLEAEKPYISEVFLSTGDTEYAALADMVQYGVDGYVEGNLNMDAGGKHVYLGYKRTADAEDALRDLVVYQGKNPDLSKRIDINDVSVKYTLVADIDLNRDAGGKWLYLYSPDSEDTGNPIMKLHLKVGSTVSTHICDVEQVTVKRADGSAITTENIDLNKSAGGKYLYLIMTREALGGHSSSLPTEYVDVPPTCGEDGYYSYRYDCTRCGEASETVLKVYPATGEHVDSEGDGDHECDVCGEENLTAHVNGEIQKENIIPSTCAEKGTYHAVVYCVECEDERRNTVLFLEIDPDNHWDSSDADHDCDLCGKLKVEEHTEGEPEEKDRVEPTLETEGSYLKVISCEECGEKLSEETVILPVLEIEEEEKEENEGAEEGEEEQDDKRELTASLLGNGSIIMICVFAAFAVAVGSVIYLQKKKKGNKGEKDNE